MSRPQTVEEEFGIPPAVRRAFPDLDGPLAPSSGESGLLHETRFLATADGRELVLQRVNQVFSPEIHDNIEAVTRHLAARGVETLRLLRTREGGLFVEAGERGRWRLMTRLPGVSFHRVSSVAQVASAGELVGRFHAALEDFDAPLADMGMSFHDTPHYRVALAEAIDRYGGHPALDTVRAIGTRIDEGFEHLGPVPEVRTRVIHGDLKISNVLFEGADLPGRDRARALIDFDTLMRGPLWCEWGDAWRSWCNRAGEDEARAEFDLDLFDASLGGFARGYRRAIDPSEAASLVDATERIALELAVRYAADALESSYFAWDATRYQSATEHNLVRARGQLELFDAARGTRDERRRRIDRLVAQAGAGD